MLGSIFQPPANSIGEEKAKYEGIAYKSEAVGLPETENQHEKNIWWSMLGPYMHI